MYSFVYFPQIISHTALVETLFATLGFMVYTIRSELCFTMVLVLPIRRMDLRGWMHRDQPGGDDINALKR